MRRLGHPLKTLLDDVNSVAQRDNPMALFRDGLKITELLLT
jgi:hypothetical protein